MTAFSGHQWMAWCFGIGCVAFLAAGILSRSARAWPVHGWISGVCAGFVFLSFRFEFVAFTTWIVSTVLCLAFLAQSLRRPRPPGFRSWKMAIPAAAVALAVGSILLFSFRFRAGDGEIPDSAYALGPLGVRLVRENAASFLLLWIGLVFVALGMGRLLRSRKEESP